MISNSKIDSGKAFDWGKTSDDYAKYRDIYPKQFYDKILELGLCLDGQAVLDLGTGTGVLPRYLYKYGAKFVGADISENQIKSARKLSQEAGMDIDYVVASAENFDFPSGSFDVVTACQCIWYFDKNIAFKKIHDVLKMDGHFAILVMNWLPFESEIAQKSEEFVLKYNPNWNGKNHTRSPIKFYEELDGLFEIEKRADFVVDVNFTRESWHGRMKACRGTGASLSETDLAKWEKDHTEFMQTLPETFNILHYVTILNLRKID